MILGAHRRYRIADENFTDRTTIESRRKEIEASGGHVQPLYMYDHGGITISTKPYTDVWDSGQLGWVAVEHEVLKRLSIDVADKERIRKIVEREVAQLDEYLTGQVCAFEHQRVRECDQGHLHEETVRRVGGFWGCDHDKSGLLREVGVEAGDESGERVWKAVG